MPTIVTPVEVSPVEASPVEVSPAEVSPNEKDVRINVTRDPDSYAPDRNNPAVPCGYQNAGTWCW